MSRDLRDDFSREDVSHDVLSRGDVPSSGRDLSPSRNPSADRRSTGAPQRTWSPADRLHLPRTPGRRPVTLDRQRFMLRGSESELLATVGVFRAIPLRDLKPYADNARPNERSSFDADVRSLRDQRLLEMHTIIINGRPESVAVVTLRGRDLIEHALAPRSSPLAVRAQRFDAGSVKLRDLAHDAQLYRLFQTERERLETEGSTVTRVVLGNVLQADYYRYVHAEHLAGVDPVRARRAFAAEQNLSFAGERLHLPDVRVEYETADGRSEYRDLELATEHYSRGKLSGKVGAGFRVYRAAGARGDHRRGSAPSHPHRLESIA